LAVPGAAVGGAQALDQREQPFEVGGGEVRDVAHGVSSGGRRVGGPKERLLAYRPVTTDRSGSAPRRGRTEPLGEIKVTDKRMFTPDGRLREEFEQLDRETPPAEPEAAAPPEPEAPAAAAPSPAPAPASPDWESAGRGPALELPGTPPGLGGPNFADLVAALAEPATLYLGDVPMPDGATAENLEA